MPRGRGRKAMIFGDKCKDCGQELTQFNGVIKQHHLQTRCKICHKKSVNDYQSRQSEARKNNYIKWKFGIKPDEYQEKFNLQLGGCAICKQPPKDRRLAVDHSHKTNQIRDLLCVKCNAVLGLINDDEELLFACIEYLKRHELKNAI